MGQIGVATIGAIGGGGEPQSVGRNGVFGDHSVKVAGQVVALVADQQGILVAQVFGVDGGAVVGGDQNGAAIPRAAAQEAHLHLGEGGFEVGIPLVHEIQGGYCNQRGPGRGLHGELGQVGFAAGGGEHDHAAPAMAYPGLQGLLLVGIGR